MLKLILASLLTAYSVLALGGATVYTKQIAQPISKREAINESSVWACRQVYFDKDLKQKTVTKKESKNEQDK